MSEEAPFEVWGRPDSSAVARVMWTLGELELPVLRHDWGGAFGGNDDADYRRMQPAGRIPALRLPDGRTLWESAAIVRYLAATYASDALIPADPYERARAEAWMDWAGAFAGAVGLIRSAYRTPDAKQADLDDALARAAPVFEVLERALDDGPFLAGERFGVADIALGVWGHRLHRCPDGARPANLPNIENWLARLRERSAYAAHVVAHVSQRPQAIGMRT